jgi:hypothetical protein
MIAVSIAYGHHLRTLAVYVIAAVVLGLVLAGAAVVRAWLLEDPCEDVLGDVERAPERRALRSMATTQRPGSSSSEEPLRSPAGLLIVALRPDGVIPPIGAERTGSMDRRVMRRG